MSRLPLKEFQTRAVESGLEVFLRTQELLDAADRAKDAASRATAIHTHGYLLIEAPTGAGKTLMAGHLVERFSARENVVWFWFAPFRGVVDQTAAALRAEFTGLRLRSLADDRQAADAKAGDVFVTTWGSVATRLTDRRSVRRSGELGDSVDELIAALRARGLRLGVVVDEAHHGFHGETQAALFFRGVLQPEYTVLITATPDDADLADLRERMHLGELHRISISRQDAVEAGLVKDGIRCIAWRADDDRAALVDFELTALREGVQLHRLIKAALAVEGVRLTPLLLVQVDSTTASVKRAQAHLLNLGFTSDQIATHTADEPDAGLLALANDETREVLVFKMAVALGFDAPRAWTLVSMRATKDPDFGVQLVGRILRVHRRLQGRRTTSDLLRHGYVLLADEGAQRGIGLAGERINQLRTEYAKASPTTVIVHSGAGTTVQVLGADGSTSLFPVAPVGALPPAKSDDPAQTTLNFDGAGAAIWAGQGLLIDLAKLDPTAVPLGGQAIAPGGAASACQTQPARYRYPLRQGGPRSFRTQLLPADFAPTEEACAQRFMVDAAAMLDVFKARVRVQRFTLDVFTGDVQRELAFAPVAPEELAVQAQRILQSEVFDQKELWKALVARLTTILRDKGFDEADEPERVKHFLDLLLVTHPSLLRLAQKQALAAGTQLVEAAALPVELLSDAPLPASVGNVYGRMPPGMNQWETSFAAFLDADGSGQLLWWHRNPARKDWSVRVLLADGSGFFPDFIVGVKDRSKPANGLLADTKYAFELRREQQKILAEHSDYGRVLILYKSGANHWSMVKFDHDGRPQLGDEFRLVSAAGY